VALDAVIQDRTLSYISLGGRFLIALPYIVEMEQDLAAVFATKVGPNRHFGGTQGSLVTPPDSKLNAAQQRAVQLALAHNLVLVSGGAGTGKTHLIATLTALYSISARNLGGARRLSEAV